MMRAKNQIRSGFDSSTAQLFYHHNVFFLIYFIRQTSMSQIELQLLDELESYSQYIDAESSFENSTEYFTEEFSDEELDYFDESATPGELVQEATDKCVGCFTFDHNILLKQLKHLRTHLKNHFSNQVELMLDMIPMWARFLCQNSGYGHFTFVNNTSNDVVVYIVIQSKTVPKEILEKEIRSLFYGFGCKVANFRLSHATETHQLEHFKKPLYNQLYQLFLLAIENQINWRVYQDLVEEWEAVHYTERYFRTHFSHLLYSLGTTPKTKDDLTAILSRWEYILIPFYNLDWGLTQSRYSTDRAMKDFRSHPNYHAIDQLIHIVYNIDKERQQEVTGYWNKVFGKYI